MKHILHITRKVSFVVIVALSMNTFTTGHLRADWKEKAKEIAHMASSWVHKLGSRLKATAKTIPHSIMQSTVGATHIDIGEAGTLAWEHELNWELDKGFEGSEGQMVPFTLQLVWYLIEDQIPSALKKINDELTTFTPASMCLLHYAICIASAYSKVISLAELPIWFSRMNYKASLSEGKLGKNGPREFYVHLPSPIRSLLNALKIPVRATDKLNFDAFATSKVAPNLWKVAANHRSRRKYSQRLTAARDFFPLIEKRGNEFNDLDVASLKYWLQVNVGEFESKVDRDDKKMLKKQLIEFMHDTADALGRSNLAAKHKQPSIDFVNGLIKNISDDSIDIKWATAEYPSISSTAKLQLKTDGYLGYSWNSMKWEEDASRLSIYPYANLKGSEITRMIFAIFDQLDRDTAMAMEKFREDRNGEGPALYRALKKSRIQLNREYVTFNRARKEAAEEALDNDEPIGEVDDGDVKVAQQELGEAMKEFEQAAAHYPFITFQQELADSMSGRKSKPLSAYNKMYHRFALLQIVCGARKFVHFFKKNGALLLLYGLDFNEAMKEIASIATNFKIDDEGNPLVAKKFAPEEEEDDDATGEESYDFDGSGGGDDAADWGDDDDAQPWKDEDDAPADPGKGDDAAAANGDYAGDQNGASSYNFSDFSQYGGEFE